MLTSRVLLVPSVPTLLVDEQRGDYTEMIEALTGQAEQLAREAPQAIVVVSARWVSPAAFLADDARRHRSLVDMPGYGAEPRYDCQGRPALARAIVEAANAAGLRAETGRRGVDSGVAIPLHFLARTRRVPIVPISLSDASREQHRAWGGVIRRVLDARPERVAFVVGGTLTLSLHDFNLKREVPESRALDEQLLDLLRRGAWTELSALAPNALARGHAEAGLHHLDVLRGFLLADAPGRVLEYETVPGIGSALVEFELTTAA